VLHKQSIAINDNLNHLLQSSVIAISPTLCRHLTPTMLEWRNLMARNVAGPIIKYNDSFFDWLWPHMLMTDDYAYVGLDFRGDPDLALPEDA
jgi:hypothetical protein